jgi:hypothetical protein
LYTSSLLNERDMKFSSRCRSYAHAHVHVKAHDKVDRDVNESASGLEGTSRIDTGSQTKRYIELVS